MSLASRKKSGATAIEYGLLAALIAVICIGVIGSSGYELERLFSFIGYKILSPNYTYQSYISTAGSIGCSYTPNVEGFTDQFGDVVTADGCFSGGTQSSALGHMTYDMANDQGLYFFNDKGKTLNVPPFFGQSTNFTVQAGDEVQIYSNNLNSSTNISFSIKTKTGNVSTQNLSSASQACKNSGGTLNVSSTNNIATCVGGTPASGEVVGVIQ